MAGEIQPSSEGPITKANYWPRAIAFIKSPTTKDFSVLIDKSSAEWNAWWQYFERHLDFVPIGMQWVLGKKLENFLVPSQHPEWFDSSFSEDRLWVRKRYKWDDPDEVPNARVVEGLRLLKLHLQSVPDQRRFAGRKAWVPPTDDELRALYKPQSEAAE